MAAVRSSVTTAVVAAPFDAAALAFRGELTCWLPPALPGEASGSWRTRVRPGFVPLTLECRATAPFSRGKEVSRHVRVRAVPGPHGSAVAARLAGAFSGDLILRPAGAERSALQLRRHRAAGASRSGVLTRSAVHAFVDGVAARLATSPAAASPQTTAGTLRTVVTCPVVRP